jgi:protein tyrosine/serine phosphatase
VTAGDVRRVGLDGPANFRDLGGYPAGARRLRRGRVFRSDSLSRMSDADVRRVAALLLSVLGVDDETVAADYALTSEHIDELLDRHRARAESEGSPVEVNDAFFAAEAAVMRNVLAELRHRYGSAEGYLEAHGLEAAAVASLRAALLDDAEREP